MRIVDANLLIYAFDVDSPQHVEARNWLEGMYLQDDIVGLPQVVLLAFLRIVTNPRIMKTCALSDEALSRVEALLNHPKTIVIECGPNHWSIFKDVVSNASVFGPSITDAFLASLAIEHGSTLCSYDEGFRRFVGLKFENPLSLRGR
jgi:toxin-antitoxin system PIN domain toxin